MKAEHGDEATVFIDIPNVGPRIARDFEMLGLKKPQDLKRQDPYTLYMKLSKKTGKRQDPCVLDTFMAVVDFMNGAEPAPWWKYTRERKRSYPDV